MQGCMLRFKARTNLQCSETVLVDFCDDDVIFLFLPEGGSIVDLDADVLYDIEKTPMGTGLRLSRASTGKEIGWVSKDLRRRTI